MSEEKTFKDQAKRAGKWVSNHKKEIAIVSAVVVTGAILYKQYKSVTKGTLPSGDGVIVPITNYLSTDDVNYRWGLAVYKYDSEGAEVALDTVIDQLSKGLFNQIDEDIFISKGDL